MRFQFSKQQQSGLAPPTEWENSLYVNRSRILLLIAWLASFFFLVSGILTYVLPAVAAFCIIIYVMLTSCRRCRGANPL